MIHITDENTTIINDEGDLISFHPENRQSIQYEHNVLTIWLYNQPKPIEIDDPDPEDIYTLLNITIPTTEPETLHIHRITRGETQNSGSPIWRMYDDDANEQVNVFKHEDPEKNNFNLVEDADYAEIFNAMQPDSEQFFDTPIIVKITQPGKWNELQSISPRIETSGRVMHQNPTPPEPPMPPHPPTQPPPPAEYDPASAALATLKAGLAIAKSIKADADQILTGEEPTQTDHPTVEITPADDPEPKPEDTPAEESDPPPDFPPPNDDLVDIEF